jgi:hypothetical protein
MTPAVAAKQDAAATPAGAAAAAKVSGQHTAPKPAAVSRKDAATAKCCRQAV